MLRLPCASRPTRRSGTRRLRRLKQPSLGSAPGCDARQGKSRTAAIGVTVSNVGSAATLAPARSAGQSGARAWLSERRSREFQARRIGRASQRTRPAGGRGPGAMVLDTFPLRKVSRRRGRNPASKAHRCRRRNKNCRLRVVANNSPESLFRQRFRRRPVRSSDRLMYPFPDR